MSNIQAFQTQIAKTGATGATAQTAAALSGSGFFAAGASAAFWDIIVARLSEEIKTPVTAVKTDAALTTASENATASLEAAVANLGAALDETLIMEDGQLSPEAEALLGETTLQLDAQSKPLTIFELLQLMQAQDQAAPADLKVTRIERVQKQIDLYQKVIEKLTAGLPLEAKGNMMVEMLAGKLEHRIETLQASLEFMQSGTINGEEAPIPLLIAMGLSPAQITELTARIAKVEEKLGRELTVEDIIAGVGGLIVPADPNKDLKPVAKVGFGASGIPADVANVPADALAAKLNNIIVGDAEEASQSTRYQRVEEQPVKLGDAPALQINTSTKSNTPAPSFSSVMLAQKLPANVVVPADWHPLFLENITASGFDIQTGLPITQAAQAAHTATSVAQAGQSHPSAHLVVATLSKMARGDATTEMTIQMDPPELGRVLAKLQFGKDKTVKAVLMVEKPETYQMLIRDAAALERALQNAGLTTDSASLSFELAQDGSAFHSKNDGEGGGEPSGKGNAANTADSDDIIQSTMTWQVDPGTGYIRYSMWA